MKLATTVKILATGLALLVLVFEVAAGDPIFVKWLVVDDPGDETVRLYWERAEAGELSPKELVDLGTMLFYRGWPNDAVTYFRQALDEDPELSDAWFRIGLVEHHGGDLADARSAYKKCLKKQSGHAWANFYLGLLEEQTGEGRSAMKHYEMAFKHAPELADPRINPEVLSSKLQLGAQVRHFDTQRFKTTMPMPFLEPAAVRKAQRQSAKAASTEAVPEPETAGQVAPTPVPAAATSSGVRTPTTRSSRGASTSRPAGSAATATVRGSGQTTTELPDPDSTPFGVPVSSGHGTNDTGGQKSAPRIGETSPEASLLPMWPGLYELAKAFI